MIEKDAWLGWQTLLLGPRCLCKFFRLFVCFLDVFMESLLLPACFIIGRTEVAASCRCFSLLFSGSKGLLLLHLFFFTFGLFLRSRYIRDELEVLAFEEAIDFLPMLGLDRVVLNVFLSVQRVFEL